MIPWPHHVPRHLCVTIKSSVSGKPAAEWLMPCAGEESSPILETGKFYFSGPHTQKIDPFNHSHGSYSGQQAWCLQFPRPLLKNDTFSDQMLQTASTELWLLAGLSFFVRERGQAIFNLRWKFECPSTPWAHQPPLPDIAGFQPRQGVSGGHGSLSEQRDSTVPLLAMVHLLSLNAQNPTVEFKRGYRWVIENGVRLVWLFVNACDCLLVLLLAGSDIPRSFISHTFLHVLGVFLQCGLSSARCRWQAGIESRMRAVKAPLYWIWWKKTNAYRQDKIMSAVQSIRSYCFWVLSLTWNWDWLRSQNNNAFWVILTASLICFSTYSCLL